MDKSPLANWNGQEMSLDQVRVSALDRAFSFGDAVYEEIRVYERRPWLCDAHIDRLANNLSKVRIKCDVSKVRDRMLETLEHSHVRDGLAYIQISRGAAPRILCFPPPDTPPNELIYIQDFGGDPFAEVRDSGVTVVTHPDLRWGRCDIKSVNLLANCLANQAAVEAGCFEAILVTADGFLTEGTHTSVFVVEDGRLITTPKGHGILSGITRDLVLDLAKTLDIECCEHAIRVGELATIDESFVAGSTVEVLSIVSVDQRPVGSGSPGPITRLLQDYYRSAIVEWLWSDLPA